MKLEMHSVYKKQENFSLKNINLEVDSPSIVGIVGENGAGKTTLLNLLSQNTFLDSGHIYAPSKKKIGFVLDSNHIPDELTPQDITTIFPYIHKTWDKRIFSKYLTLFELPENKPLKKYSKGMLMKVNIAIVLAHKPTFLLLDEITGGLDPFIRDYVLSIIKDYVYSYNAIAIMTTHILEDVIKIANKIVVLNNGEIVENKKTEEFNSTEELQEFLKKSNRSYE